MAVRLWLWTLVLVLSTLFWGVWQMPARPLLASLDGTPMGQAPLRLQRIEGVWREGAAHWQWQGLSGRLQWSLDWRGLTPGVQLQLSGDVIASGWLGGRPGAWQVQALDLALPVAPLVRGMPGIQAEGTASIRGLTLIWGKQGPEAAEARLDYTGGNVSWAPGQGAEVPPLTGLLRHDGAAARLDARDPQGTLLAEGSVENDLASLRVYRAWPMLLGASQGGSPGDVVFETSRPLADNNN